MNRLIESLRALYSPSGGVCRPDTKTPACEAGANDTEIHVMKRNVTGSPDIFNPPPKDSMHVILKEGRKMITPNMARRILEETNYSGQRPVADHHVKLLAHIMEEGRWRSGDQLAFCRLDGRLILTNGQHRMHAVIVADRAQEFQILITECMTLEEVQADYHRHDIVARKRSNAEIMASTGIGDESGLPKQFLVKLFQAGPILENDLQPVHYLKDTVAQRDIDSRIETVRDWLGEARLYEQFIRSAPKHVKQSLINAGVMAVALVTIRYQPQQAAEFWRGLAEDDGLRRGDPRKTLLQDLESRHVRRGAFHAQRVIPALTAWNAFFEGRTLKIIKVSESSQITVRGTPIKGQ